MSKQVDHPAHYNMGSIEVIDAIEDWNLGMHEANCVKYVARARHKGSELQDLEKARWYLDRKIEALRQDQSRPEPAPTPTVSPQRAWSPT